MSNITIEIRNNVSKCLPCLSIVLYSWWRFSSSSQRKNTGPPFSNSLSIYIFFLPLFYCYCFFFSLTASLFFLTQCNCYLYIFFLLKFVCFVVISFFFYIHVNTCQYNWFMNFSRNLTFFYFFSPDFYSSTLCLLRFIYWHENLTFSWRRKIKKRKKKIVSRNRSKRGGVKKIFFHVYNSVCPRANVFFMHKNIFVWDVHRALIFLSLMCDCPEHTLALLTRDEK